VRFEDDVKVRNRGGDLSLQSGGERLDSFGGNLLHALGAGDDALDSGEDGGPVFEFVEGDVLLDAVGY
jgi:hypothetical protein